jgi:hypothetical protein
MFQASSDHLRRHEIGRASHSFAAAQIRLQQFAPSNRARRRPGHWRGILGQVHHGAQPVEGLRHLIHLVARASLGKIEHSSTKASTQGAIRRMTEVDVAAFHLWADRLRSCHFAAIGDDRHQPGDLVAQRLDHCRAVGLARTHRVSPHAVPFRVPNCPVGAGWREPRFPGGPPRSAIPPTLRTDGATAPAAL